MRARDKKWATHSVDVLIQYEEQLGEIIEGLDREISETIQGGAGQYSAVLERD